MIIASILLLAAEGDYTRSFVFLVLFRNEKTSRDDFIFYSKRLVRILIEHALSLLPFKVSMLY